MIVNGIYKNHPVNPIPLMGFDEFAKALGFSNWDELIENSTLIHSEAWVTFFITKLKSGKWAAWNTEDLHYDFVEFLNTKKEAVQYWENYLRHVGLRVF